MIKKKSNYDSFQEVLKKIFMDFEWIDVNKSLQIIIRLLSNLLNIQSDPGNDNLPVGTNLFDESNSMRCKKLKICSSVE